MTRHAARQYCLSAVVASGLLLALLAAAVTLGDVVPVDAALRDFVHPSHAAWLTDALERVTGLGSVKAVVLLTILAFAGFWALHRHKDAKALAWTMIAAMLVENGMKYSFQRSRPEPFFDVPLPDSYSFPSGHALFATCLYAAIAWGISGMVRTVLARRLVWALAVTLIAAIGFSRVYLGVHYPSDVAAGWLAGCLCVCLVRLWQGGNGGVQLRSTGQTNPMEPSDDQIHRTA